MRSFVAFFLNSPPATEPSTLSHTTLFRSDWPPARLQRATHANLLDPARLELAGAASTVIQSLLNDSSAAARQVRVGPDRKSTRLNSSHVRTSYAVFCLKKKNRSKELRSCL